VTAGAVGLLLFRSGFATYATTRAAAESWCEAATVPTRPAAAATRGAVATAH
jgi:hypothetical protein